MADITSRGRMARKTYVSWVVLEFELRNGWYTLLGIKPRFN
jgi:hypothetical protein